MSKKNRKHAFSWYLLFLGLSENIFLCVYIPEIFVFYYTNCVVDISTFVNCTVRYFAFLCSSEFSSFLLVLMSIERFVMIVHPEKAKYVSTPLRTKLSCFILAIVLAGINAFHIVAYQVYTINGVSHCVPRPEYDYILDNVWPIVDRVLYAYLPAILMLSFSGGIMCGNVQSSQQYTKTLSASDIGALHSVSFLHHHHSAHDMMTSSNGNIFRVTGPLCGEFTGPGSPHKGQWRGALMFYLICARINDWVNNR